VVRRCGGDHHAAAYMGKAVANCGDEVGACLGWVSCRELGEGYIGANSAKSKGTRQALDRACLG
jgi:hypothetical protein